MQCLHIAVPTKPFYFAFAPREAASQEKIKMMEQFLHPLSELASSLENRSTEVTQLWIDAVLVDEQIQQADRLTSIQLLDHLPSLYEELCGVLAQQALQAPAGGLHRRARDHGRERWAQGYRLDELARELDLLRRILLEEVVAEFAATHPDFRGEPEAKARYLIEETFSVITLDSIRQMKREQDAHTAAHLAQLEHANQLLQEQQAQLRDLAASRVQVTRGIAHDLRNFLNVFASTQELIRRDPTRLDAALQIAQRQTVDMSDLVDQLLQFSVSVSGSGTVALDAVDIGALVAEFEEDLREAFEAKGLGFRTVIDDGVASVHTDRLKLKQIGVNLLSNALKYTDRGEVALMVGEARPGHWFLRVADTGRGIDIADQSRVFDEFERAGRDDMPGVGLGLAIVKELVHALKGELVVTSSPGDGSTFEITFPAQLRHAGTHPAPSGPSA